MKEYNCSLAVVIVNYRTAKLVCDLLDALIGQLNSICIDAKVFVVDNKSGDDSVNILSGYIDNNMADRVTLICSDLNGGFAYGNNIVIRQLLQLNNPPDYIYMLNPDALVMDNAITELMSFMDSKPEVGIVGGRLQDLDGTPQQSSFKFHTWITEIDRGFNLGVLTNLLRSKLSSVEIPDIACKTDWVAGASMMIKTEVFMDIGLLDESYFMYYEEMDFCLQASRAGWECWYVPDSHVVHFVGQSSGITDRKIKAARRPAYWFESRRRFFLKNYGVCHAVVADLLWMLGFSTWKVKNFFHRKTHNFPPYFLFDSFMNSTFVKGLSIRPVRNE